MLHLANVLLVGLALIRIFHYALDYTTDNSQDGSFSDLVNEYNAKDLAKAVIS